MQKLIARMVGRYCRKYGLPFDEAWSAASLGFCQAHDKYDGRVPFPKWCAWLVEKRLVDLVRDTAAHRLEYGYDMSQVATRQFDAASLFWRLDADGIEVVMITLDPPGAMKHRARKEGNTIWAYRHALKRQLHDMGWSDERINRSFRQIRRQL